MNANNTTTMNLSAYLDTTHGRFNLWWQGAFLMLGLLAVTLLLWWIDPRQLDGVSVWTKPLKFEISLVIYFVTLALLAGLLPRAIRKRKDWKWATLIAVGAGLFEVLYITLQAARGRHSHFNDSTALESTMYGLMGVGAVLLVAVSFHLGWLLYRHHHSGEHRILRTAAIWGLILGSILTLLTAGSMSSLTSHFVSTPAADAWTVPFFGWSLSGGDLRIPHFFATHLMQFLPLYGLWLERHHANAGQAGFASAQFKLWVFALVYCVVVVTWFATSFITAGM